MRAPRWPVEHEAELFAKRLASYLEKARVEQRFDRIRLVAAPKFLGLLRQNLSKELDKMVDEAIAKDVSWFDQNALAEYLHDKAAWAEPPADIGTRRRRLTTLQPPQHRRGYPDEHRERKDGGKKRQPIVEHAEIGEKPSQEKESKPKHGARKNAKPHTARAPLALPAVRLLSACLKCKDRRERIHLRPQPIFQLTSDCWRWCSNWRSKLTLAIHAQ